MNDADHLTSLDWLAYVPRLQFRQIVFVYRTADRQSTAITNRCGGSVVIVTVGDVGRGWAHERKVESAPDCFSVNPIVTRV